MKECTASNNYWISNKKDIMLLISNVKWKKKNLVNSIQIILVLYWSNNEKNYGEEAKKIFWL